MGQYLVSWITTKTQAHSVFIDANAEPTPRELMERLAEWEQADLSPPLPVTTRAVTAVQPIPAPPASACPCGRAEDCGSGLHAAE